MTTTATPTLSPFALAKYLRSHAPAAARCGMRGYILNILVGMVAVKGPDKGTCFPSVSYLAETVGRSTRHVRRCLAELEAMGEIKRIYRKRKDGGWSSSLYELRGLLAWAKNVLRVSDKGSRKTPTGRTSTPARGVKSNFQKMQAAQNRPALTPAPVARPVTAENGLEGVLSDPSASPAQSRGLSPAQVEEARAKCDPVRWAKLLIEAGTDGAKGDDLAMGAARRWRADAIMQRIQLAT